MSEVSEKSLIYNEHIAVFPYLSHLTSIVAIKMSIDVQIEVHFLLMCSIHTTSIFCLSILARGVSPVLVSY